MRNTPVVFICGKYDTSSPWELEKCIMQAREYGRLFLQCGAYPIIPHSNTGTIAVGIDQNLLDSALIKIVKTCDGVFIAPGAGDSVEPQVEAARLAGIPILDGWLWGGRGGASVADDVLLWLEQLQAGIAARSTGGVMRD